MSTGVHSWFLYDTNEIWLFFFFFFCMVMHTVFIFNVREKKKKKNPFSLNELFVRASYIKSFHLYTVTYYTHLVCLHNVFSHASVPALYLWTHYILIPAKVHSHYSISDQLFWARHMGLFYQSIMHSLILKQKMSWVFKSAGFFGLTGEGCNGCDEVLAR